jgi:hypothetical protein
MAKKLGERRRLVRRFLAAGQSEAEAEAHADRVLQEPDVFEITRSGEKRQPDSPMIINVDGKQ